MSFRACPGIHPTGVVEKVLYAGADLCVCNEGGINTVHPRGVAPAIWNKTGFFNGPQHRKAWILDQVQNDNFIHADYLYT